MKRSSSAYGLALVLVAVPCAWSGPAEVNGLRARLDGLEAAIRATEDRMREALKNRTGAAGGEGVQLRALKRERAEVKQSLQQATAEGERREAVSKSMPTPKPARDQGPAARRPPPDRKPQVDVAPVGEMVPAPSL